MTFCLWWQHPGLHKKRQVASQGWVSEVPNMVMNGQFMFFSMMACSMRCSLHWFQPLLQLFAQEVRGGCSALSHFPPRKKKQVPTKALHLRLSSVAAKPQKKGPSSATFCNDGWATSYLNNNSTSWLPKKKCTFVSEGYFGTNAGRRQQVESKLKETA